MRRNVDLLLRRNNNNNKNSSKTKLNIRKCRIWFPWLRFRSIRIGGICVLLAIVCYVVMIVSNHQKILLQDPTISSRNKKNHHHHHHHPGLVDVGHWKDQSASIRKTVLGIPNSHYQLRPKHDKEDTNDTSLEEQQRIKGSSSKKRDGSLSSSSAAASVCKVHSLDQLEEKDLHPKAGPDRHIVDPPEDNMENVYLVCCDTSVGPLSIAVHPSWAPLGAQRFLTMVRQQYFSSKVPFMRCIANFICQFGIAGDPKIDKPFKNDGLPDDPNWLPEGKEHRMNQHKVKRFAKGYLAYAGGGKNSRTNQFIVALKDNGPLGGGSPWEVPWGELVGPESFHTLDKIYTGYGEKGPSQGMLHNQGFSPTVQKLFPKLDYIQSCTIVDQTKS